MSLLSQTDFSGGLNTEFDPTKSPSNAYPLLINGRARRNVIEPTRKHVQIDMLPGNYQGLYGAGNFLALFVDGIAYYADITESPINFIPIANWAQMDPVVSRIYAEIVPAQSNFFNHSGPVLQTESNFNASIAAFREALFVFDGTIAHRPQAIFPNGSVQTLPDYADWTKDRPLYVPYGLLPCFTANKLFLVSPDKKRILQSVSGRAGDFMVNIINATGEAGGDANTVSATVSFNDITSIRALASGQLLVSTLYGSWGIGLDYDNTYFGEPYLNPIFLFPAGAVNELSSISLASEDATGGFADTAFITQSGIVAFNAVGQALHESNNFSLGAPIKGLLLNPADKKPLTQEATCAITFDDYGFFAVNTIYGYGALVYDTVRRMWVSLDLAFGRAKQFVNIRVNGQERLFFITHDNKVFEAFADDGAVNSARIYLGEFAPAKADSQLLLHLIDAVFLNVKSSGQLKLTLFADGKKHDEAVLDVTVEGFKDAPPITIPFVSKIKSITPGWQLGDKALCWNAGVMLEWNFDGQLAELGIDGAVHSAENVKLDKPVFIEPESFAFLGETGSEELNTGADFVDGFICVPVIKGHTYVYFSNGNGRLVSGNIVIAKKGTFVANQDTAAIEGPGIPTWSLRDITNLTSVRSAIDDLDIYQLIGGGNHSYHFGSKIDVEVNHYPFGERLFTLAGPVDIGADKGMYFYNHYGIPRYYTKKFPFVEFFFYNYDPNEPDGAGADSIQFAWLQNKLAESTRQFKIVVVAMPPYSTEEDLSPGYVAMRLPWGTIGASAVLSGVGRVMERYVIDGLPYFLCGTGGAGLGGFATNTADEAVFRANSTYGYLEIKSDPLTCLFTFRDTANNVLDEYAIYT